MELELGTRLGGNIRDFTVNISISQEQRIWVYDYAMHSSRGLDRNNTQLRSLVSHDFPLRLQIVQFRRERERLGDGTVG